MLTGHQNEYYVNFTSSYVFDSKSESCSVS